MLKFLYEYGTSSEEGCVLCLVTLHFRVSVLGEVPLFRSEMRGGIVDQLDQDAFQGFFVAALLPSTIELVEHGRHTLVLLIDLSHVDAATVIPVDQGHGF